KEAEVERAAEQKRKELDDARARLAAADARAKELEAAQEVAGPAAAAAPLAPPPPALVLPAAMAAAAAAAKAKGAPAPTEGDIAAATAEERQKLALNRASSWVDEARQLYESAQQLKARGLLQHVKDNIRSKATRMFLDHVE